VSGFLLAPLLAARWVAEVPPPPPQAIFALMELLKLVAMAVALGTALVWNQTFGKLFAWLGGALNFKVLGQRPLGSLAHGLKVANDRVVNFLGGIALVNEGGMVTWISWTGNTTEHAAKEHAAVAESTTAAFDRMQTVFLPYFVTHTPRRKPLTTRRRRRRSPRIPRRTRRRSRAVRLSRSCSRA
jgi:hypothetical protein